MNTFRITKSLWISGALHFAALVAVLSLSRSGDHVQHASTPAPVTVRALVLAPTKITEPQLKSEPTISPAPTPPPSSAAAPGPAPRVAAPVVKGTPVSYASSTPRNEVDIAANTRADLSLSSKLKTHDPKLSRAAGDADKDGIAAPVLAIDGLRWNMVDRLVSSGAMAVWIDLGEESGRLMYDKTGLHDVTGLAAPHGFSERRFNLSLVKGLRADAAGALEAGAAQHNVLRQALEEARFELLMRVEIDECFLASQRAVADRNGVTLQDISRTDGVIDFGEDGHPIYRVIRAVSVGAKVLH